MRTAIQDFEVTPVIESVRFVIEMSNPRCVGWAGHNNDKRNHPMASLAEHLSGPSSPALSIVPKKAATAVSFGLFGFGITTIILSCCILTDALNRTKRSR